MFQPAELEKYDGSSTVLPPYLAILGEVYDVTAGRKYYGENTNYEAALGRDASLAFATGKFTVDILRRDIVSCTPEEAVGLSVCHPFFFFQLSMLTSFWWPMAVLS